VALRHPALVLQAFVPGSGALSLELRCGARTSLHVHFSLRTRRADHATHHATHSCTDAGGSRRRLAFSTAFVELNGKGLVAQVPLPLPRGRWLNVLLHVSELLTALYAGSQLRSIDLITLGARPRRAAPWRGVTALQRA
jgi:hypothetical protein